MGAWLRPGTEWFVKCSARSWRRYFGPKVRVSDASESMGWVPLMTRMVVFLMAVVVGTACSNVEVQEVMRVEEWALVDTLFDPIGTVDGPPTHTLYRARDVRHLGSGLLAVANAREEIRLFRTDGSFVRQFGREGGGPGEFGNLSRLFRLRDTSLLAIDGMRERALRFDTLGNLLSEFSLDPEHPLETASGYAVLGPDRVMVIGHSFFPNIPSVTIQTLIRPEVPLYVFDSAGGVTEVGQVLGRPREVDSGGFRFQPLAPNTIITSWRGGAVLTFGTDATLSFYDSDGKLAQVLHPPRSPVPVTDQTKSDWEEELLEALRARGIPTEGLGYPQGWILRFPATLPVYDGLLSDDLGCVWARRYRPPKETSVWYDVIDPENRSIATFSLPKTTIITDINDGLVVGIATDELGVQRIVLFEVDTGGISSDLTCDVQSDS